MESHLPKSVGVDIYTNIVSIYSQDFSHKAKPGYSCIKGWCRLLKRWNHWNRWNRWNQWNI